MYRTSKLTSAAFALIAVTLACASAGAQPRSANTQKPRAEESQTAPLTSKVAEAPRGALSKVAAPTIGSAAVTKNQCGVITITVTFNDGWKPMPGFNGNATYRLDKYVGNELSEVAASNDPVINIAWPVGDGFKFIVWARSRQTGTLGVTMVRKVGEVQGIANNYCPPPPPPYVPEAGEVRLRHEQTGTCMFGDPSGGGIVQALKCWQDPFLSYVLEPASGNEFRLRHRSTGNCVYADSTNGGIAKNWVCWDDPNMRFVKEPLPGANRFRLRHVATGQCLFTRVSSHASFTNPFRPVLVKGWAPCWDDPGMVWVADPF